MRNYRVRHDHSKIKPNDKCPCGSTEKYKKCCGRAGAGASSAHVNAGPSCRVAPSTAQVLDMIADGEVDAVKRLVQGGLDVNA